MLNRRSGLAAAGLGLVAVGGWTLMPRWLAPTPPAFGDGVTVLVADVDDQTGGTVFSHALCAALEVALMRSKWVNVFPRSRIQGSLQRAATPLDTAITKPLRLALEVATREGQQAVIAVSIADQSAGYHLAGQMIEPSTGRTVASVSVQAQRDAVLDGVETLAQGLRGLLGEPKSQITADDTPLGLATSPSLQALGLYADSQRVKPDDLAKRDALLRKAIELDPAFALAIAALATQNYDVGTRESRLEAQRLNARAVALPNRLTARARKWLVISVDDALGRREEAVVGYQAYLSQYPHDAAAWFRLGWTYMAVLKKHDQALEAFRRTTEIDPRYASAWINLATIQTGLRQHDKAVELYHKAFALDPDHRLGIYINGEYGMALLALGRADEAQAAFAAMRDAPDDPRRARGRRSMAYLLMFQGRYHDAIEQLNQAVQINTMSGQTLGAYRDRFIRAQAAWALGDRRFVVRELAELDALSTELVLGPAWLIRMIKLRAAMGDVREVQRLTARMATMVGNSQTDGGIQKSLSDDNGYLDLARSDLERLNGQATAALAHAEAAALRLGPDMVLATTARALQAAGRIDSAAVKYRELIEIAPLGKEEQEETVPARVALAAIHEHAGRKADALALYKQVADQWRDGDADLVLLKQARSRVKALSD